MSHILRFFRDESGPTAVEYAVLLALIVMACLAAIQTMAHATAESYDRSSTAIDAALNG